MNSRSKSQKNYKIKLSNNYTRKKSKNDNSMYSEGFIRRMTQPVLFTPITISDEKINEYNRKYGDNLTDEDKMKIFMMNNSTEFIPKNKIL